MPTKSTTNSTSSRQKRPPRGEGRPRLDAATAILSEDRRGQIRRAQKTYRQKKESSLLHCQQRVAELEHKVARHKELLHNYQVLLQCQLQDTHPRLLEEFNCILRELTSISENTDQSPGSDSLSLREYSEQPSANLENHMRAGSLASSDTNVGNQTPTELVLKANELRGTAISSLASERSQNGTLNVTCQQKKTHVDSPFKKSIIQAVNTSIGINPVTTYSHLESSFTRRLHRFSLEHAFRIFSDPHPNLYEVFRLFRLVPCFREREKMHPYFKNLVTADRAHPLEIFALPFYAVGGAGTHYPDLNEAGDPIYPLNMRLPRRILGILPTAERSDVLDPMDRTQADPLELCGFGGDWFDCRDVKGYLRAKGVDLNGTTAFPTIKVSKLDFHPLASSNQFGIYALDLESFLEKLLSGLAMLGRAPGFRRSHVETAFQSALHARRLS